MTCLKTVFFLCKNVTKLRIKSIWGPVTATTKPQNKENCSKHPSHILWKGCLRPGVHWGQDADSMRTTNLIFGKASVCSSLLLIVVLGASVFETFRIGNFFRVEILIESKISTRKWISTHFHHLDCVVLRTSSGHPDSSANTSESFSDTESLRTVRKYVRKLRGIDTEGVPNLRYAFWTSNIHWNWINYRFLPACSCNVDWHIKTFSFSFFAFRKFSAKERKIA